jgi:hypothetical protein
MRHARRLIATVVGVAFWCVAVSTVAYAQRVNDPGLAGTAGSIPKHVTATGTSNWMYALYATLAVLLAIAVVGLIASLRHSRARTPMLHA